MYTQFLEQKRANTICTICKSKHVYFSMYINGSIKTKGNTLECKSCGAIWNSHNMENFEFRKIDEINTISI